MKPCKRCKTSKAEVDFYARDTTCKECRKALVMAYRLQNIERYREYDRKRGMEPHRVDARRIYQQTDSGRIARINARKRYEARHPERISESRSKSKANNPEKYAARNMLWSHVLTGRITRPENCSCCGIECTPHGHHEDYSKPLDVMWLCVPCHAARHQQIKAMMEA